MKITGFGLYRFRLPLTESLTFKGTTLGHREGLLLRLEGEGCEIGWGETSPLPGFSREGLADAARGLDEYAASVVGREVTDGWIGANGDLARMMNGTDLAPSVRFGFELAVWNLYAAAHGVALPALISEHSAAVVPVNGLISGPAAGAHEEARRMREAGYEAVKLKVGSRPVAEDVALVRSVREALGGDISLRLDANRAWTLDEALEFAQEGIEDACIEYLEEPLAHPTDLETFTRDSGIPVALDESLVGMAPESLEEHRYAAAVVMKPSFLGYSRVLRLANRAASLGMRPVVSSAYETGVGTAALVALAASLGGGGIPAGLDTYRRLAEDVVEPRLPLPSTHVPVREAVASGRGVVLRRLSPEREPLGNITP